MLDFTGFPMIFAIFKIRFLHEQIIFFIQDFFQTKYDPIASISDTYNIGFSSAGDWGRIPWTIPSEEGFRAKTFFWWDYSRYMTVFAPNLPPMKIWCYKCLKSKLWDHTLSGKNPGWKILFFSWRNLILKIAKPMGNPVKSNMLRSGGEALHIAVV